jgi:Protein of unknown function (DUF1588)/Protein of unknown function (DUF1592)/Protein of unknown function (DUF1585)
LGWQAFAKKVQTSFERLASGMKTLSRFLSLSVFVTVAACSFCVFAMDSLDSRGLQALFERVHRESPGPETIVEKRGSTQLPPPPGHMETIAAHHFPGTVTGPARTRVFRLTRDQIDATAKSLFPGYSPPPIMTRMAKDPLQTNYEFAELLSFSAANIGGLTDWIGDNSARVKKNPAGLINCTASEAAGMEKCLRDEARKFIVKAFRGDVGPPNSAQQRNIKEIVEFFVKGALNEDVGLAQATAELVEIVLKSPHFLFRKEGNVEDKTVGRGPLPPERRLQSIAYTMADSPPDAVLGNLTYETTRAPSNEQQGNVRFASEFLRTPEDIGKTIDAVAASAAAREKLVRFFLAWLEVKETKDFEISQHTFKDFSPKAAAAMRDQTVNFLREKVNAPSPKLKDITQAYWTQSNPKTQPQVSLASLPAPVDMSGELGPRLGVFSQQALLASHSGPTAGASETRPIKRGVFWVRKLMCMDMAPPPPGLDLTLYEAVHKTERERIEMTTAKPVCAGCHRIINPFAFFQENYDALGRWRSEDHGLKIDASMSMEHPDDPSAKIEVTDGPVKALQALTNSYRFQQCFVRQLFRFYMGREEAAADDPLLRSLFLTFAGNEQQIWPVLKGLMRSDLVSGPVSKTPPRVGKQAVVPAPQPRTAPVRAAGPASGGRG